MHICVHVCEGVWVFVGENRCVGCSVWVWMGEWPGGCAGVGVV